MSGERNRHLHVVAVAIVLIDKGRLLSLRRSMHREAGAGLWEAFSGRVDPDEEPLDAAYREAREETGIEVDIDPRPVTSYAATRAGEPMVVIVYRATPKSRAPEVILSDEHDAFAWLTPDEFAERSSIGPLTQAVRMAFAIRNTVPDDSSR